MVGTSQRAVKAFIFASSLTAISCSTDEAAPPVPTVEGAVVEVYRLDEPPSPEGEHDDAPRCWMSFKDGERAGGCSVGALEVEEIGTSAGMVEGWNGVVSFMEVPVGWAVHSYHQMWALGPEENARRQGFLVHGPSDDPIRVQLSNVEHQIFRDPSGLNWNYCRAWSPDIFVGAPAQETAVNDNLQCLHIEPGEAAESEFLVLASEDPPGGGAQLRIRYVP